MNVCLWGKQQETKQIKQEEGVGEKPVAEWIRVRLFCHSKTPRAR